MEPYVISRFLVMPGRRLLRSNDHLSFYATEILARGRRSDVPGLGYGDACGSRYFATLDRHFHNNFILPCRSLSLSCFAELLITFVCPVECPIFSALANARSCAQSDNDRAPSLYDSKHVENVHASARKCKRKTNRGYMQPTGSELASDVLN